jgi:hypothetical protein
MDASPFGDSPTLARLQVMATDDMKWPISLREIESSWVWGRGGQPRGSTRLKREYYLWQMEMTSRAGF